MAQRRTADTHAGCGDATASTDECGWGMDGSPSFSLASACLSSSLAGGGRGGSLLQEEREELSELRLSSSSRNLSM